MEDADCNMRAAAKVPHHDHGPNPTPTPTLTSAFRFLDLPMELRLMVYEYIPIETNLRTIQLPNPRKRTWETEIYTRFVLPIEMHSQFVVRSVSSSILSTCHQIHDEALSVIKKKQTHIVSQPIQIVLDNEAFNWQAYTPIALLLSYMEAAKLQPGLAFDTHYQRMAGTGNPNFVSLLDIELGKLSCFMKKAARQMDIYFRNSAKNPEDTAPLVVLAMRVKREGDGYDCLIEELELMASMLHDDFGWVEPHFVVKARTVPHLMDPPIRGQYETFLYESNTEGPFTFTFGDAIDTTEWKNEWDPHGELEPLAETEEECETEGDSDSDA